MSAFKILETKMALPKTMSGVALIGIGGPEMLEWRDDLPVPAPSENDIIVRVKAAGSTTRTSIRAMDGIQRVIHLLKMQHGPVPPLHSRAFKAQMFAAKLLL